MGQGVRVRELLRQRQMQCQCAWTHLCELIVIHIAVTDFHARGATFDVYAGQSDEIVGTAGLQGAG